jgi:hypothetical protein
MSPPYRQSVACTQKSWSFTSSRDPESVVTQGGSPGVGLFRFASLTFVLWQWAGRSVTLFGELPPNRTQTMTLIHTCASELSQLMEDTTAGALIPEIVLRGFQDLLEAEVSAAIGATRHPPLPAKMTPLHSDQFFH